MRQPVRLGSFWNEPPWTDWTTSVEVGSLCFDKSLTISARTMLAAALAGTEHRLIVEWENPREAEESAAILQSWLPADAVHLFPASERTLGPESLPDPDAEAARLHVIERIETDPRLRVILATSAALAQPLPTMEALRHSRHTLKVGEALSPLDLADQCEQAGLLCVPRVTARGQYARRGGLLDIFPITAAEPLRIEFFGDQIDSLRTFGPEDQLKRRDVERWELLLDDEMEREARLDDFLDAGWLRVLACAEDSSLGVPSLVDHTFGPSMGQDGWHPDLTRRLALADLTSWIASQWDVWAVCRNDGEQARLEEILKEEFPGQPLPHFVQADLPTGFVWPEAGWAILTDSEIFSRQAGAVAPPTRGNEEWHRRTDAVDFGEWAEGDFVVHIQHGIAQFAGIRPLESEGGREVLTLEFAERARLYVPLEQGHLVARYVGSGKKNPELDTLGGSRWDKARKSAQRAVVDYAAKLLQLHAERQSQAGYAFPADTPWQTMFEASFRYTPTVDQAAAIEASKRDMESARPMERLICGDVGFGKTEVAIRAAFKAAMAGKQVAFLCPTTVLAEQHGKTLRERMADYPVRIEILSRFTSPLQSRQILEGLARGDVDILVGTHRILSADVRFHDVGLLVVDEEQRFGVKHKETLKEKFRQIDILTLSATPIPRTLYMAMMGARDMSTIETPPAGRTAVETAVVPFDERIVREAIVREISRGGQIYFLHNRIATISKLAARIQELVPSARILIGHGQMPDDQLEEVMRNFVAGQADVLVSTTIIESGLDIPNANTILIDRADRFGLADLYQLRGRVGRGVHKAHAYLFMPRDLATTSVAKKRAAAMRQYAQLGAGFRVAMRDLEIRGAGNLLGTQQSGHIAAIGFEMYCRLLRQAVERLKSGQEIFRRECKVEIDFVSLGEEPSSPTNEDTDLPNIGALLPASWLPDPRLRMSLYRQIAEALTPPDVESLAHAWRDQYGRFPRQVQALILWHRIRTIGTQALAEKIAVLQDQIRIQRHGDYLMIGNRFPRLRKTDPLDRMTEILSWCQDLLS